MTRRKKPHEVPSTEILERIKTALVDLKLFDIKELLEEELDRLGKGKSSATEMLLRLLQVQVHLQKERRIERRIRESKLPERKTLNNFDFDFQPDLDKSLVIELATMGFVSRRQGVILAGKSGTGKSYIAKALALQGCKEDYRVRYTTAADMLSTLYASLADDSLDQKLKQYLGPELLVIDELGFDRLEQEDARNASLFFKVIDGRYTKKSTVLTSNIDFKQLGHYLGDPVVTTAIVDRMVHHSTVITINGPSWRLKESEMLNKRPDNKKPHDSSKKKPPKKPPPRK
jgi:DNA replication protein DnaC